MLGVLDQNHAVASIRPMGDSPGHAVRLKVLVIEGPLIASQMAHWNRMRGYGVEIHIAGAMRAPNQEWWTSELPLDIPVSAFTPKGWLRRGSLWWIYPGLGALVRSLGPDVVHVAVEPWALMYSQVPLRDYRVVGHGADNIWTHGGLIERSIRLYRAKSILRRLSGFVSWNSDGVRLAHRYGLRPDIPTLVAPSRVPDPEPYESAEADRERLRHEFGIGDEEVAIGYVGRLAPEKGIDWLLRSFSLARPPGAQLHLFGSGSRESALRSLASALSVPAVFHGFVSPDHIPATMASMDLLVVPSLTTPTLAEQFGRVVVESMMAGTPVVASDSGSLPEVVGEGGVIVEEGNTQALAEQLARLGPDVLAGMRARARAWAAKRYSPDVMAAKLAGFWSDVATG